MGEDSKFRKLFVVEPSHDVSVLSKYSSNIIFLGDSEEKIVDLPNKMKKYLEDFDPDLDAIIPMGRVSSCVLAGLLVGSKLTYSDPIIIMIGIYKNEEYIFIPVEVK